MAGYSALQDVLKISRYFRFSLGSTAKIVPFSRQVSRTEVIVDTEVGGRPLRFSSGKLAFLADGATVVQYGGTSVLVTATSSKTISDNYDGLHLVVDYKEKASGACMIPSNFFRRELGPNEREIITSRFIDRSLRPLFTKGYFYDTQLTANLLVADRINNPDIAALNGASAALAISSIPWNGPIGAVRIGYIDGQFIVNPLRSQMKQSQLNLVVASSENKIIMLDGSAMEFSNERFYEAVRLGFKEVQPIISAIKELQSSVGKEKREYTPVVPSEELSNAVYNLASDKLREIFSNFTYKKLERDNEIFTLRDNCVEELEEEHPDSKTLITQAFYNTSKNVLKKNILDSKQRCDGRSVHQLRDIKCEVDIFDGLHGSALFDRGETQVFSTVTFGPLGLSAPRDSVSMAVSGEEEKKFMLHYESPPFANNESKFSGRPGRRELGHGLLSEKALLPVLPKETPFTLRITSQVLASNGSSSMASACAGSLAMMDAGVPTQKHVAGTACGLITSEDANDPDATDIDEYQILTDILGIEDYLGEMDFKIVGTRDGITALQADFKIPGVPLHIIEETIRRSSEDRNKVLDIMDSVIAEARKTKRENCPASGFITVPVEKRGQLIGVGGSIIKGLEQEFGISITQVHGQEYALFAPNQNSYDLAMSKINDLLADDKEKRFEVDKKKRLEELRSRLEKGQIYEGSIVEIRPFGVMAEVFPDCSTVLLHSKDLDHRQGHPEHLGFKIGDTIKFKYFGIDEERQRIMVSRKVLLPPSQNQSRLPTKRPFFKKKFSPRRETPIMDLLDDRD